MLYWVGPRDSDIDYTGNLFQGAITLFGEDKDLHKKAFCKNYHTRINHNIIDEEQDNFTITSVLKILKSDSSAEFMFYNPNIVYNQEKLMQISDHIIGLNDCELMRKLNNKSTFRTMFEKQVHMLDCKSVLPQDCSYNKLKDIFGLVGDNDRFIVQAPIASGGFGTFVMDCRNSNRIREELAEQRPYLVSKYLENNVSVNQHMVVFDDCVLMTPCSVQIMKLDNNRLFYRGADFVAYGGIPEKSRKEFEHMVYTLGLRLKEIGYRGICGIDGLIADGEVYILEINNRFQASTPLINLQLSKLGLPSLHQMNLKAFKKERPSEEYSEMLPNLKVGYSNYVFISGEVDFHYKRFLSMLREDKCVYLEEIVLDGYRPEQSSARGAYQYKVIFKTNIAGIDGNGRLQIHGNIAEPTRDFYVKVEKKYLLQLKVALLNQGIRISEQARKYLEQKGGIRPGTNSSVDILLDNGIVINCPVDIKFAELSPFEVDIQDGELQLLYYGNPITNIHINPIDIHSFRKTSNYISYCAVANMSSDRLRLHHTSACMYKREGKGCKFCDIQMGNERIQMQDIREVTDFYIQNTKFKHFLVGGQSEEAEYEYSKIIDTIRFIREKSKKNIYVMCLPPTDMSVIDEIHAAGATEIAFNIEIFDRELAKEIMPGKGQLALERYIKALEHAVEVFGNNGEVRSLVLIGLESERTFYNGIEELASRHIQPILSVFRPLPGTSMYHNLAPGNDYLVTVYEKANRICSKYNMRLGPDCVQCQNNTLSLPEEMRDGKQKIHKGLFGQSN